MLAVGASPYGQSGPQEGPEWRELRGAGRVQQVVCGMDHSLVLAQVSDDGAQGLLACGWAGDGQTGLGSTDNATSLQRIDTGPVQVVKAASTVDCCLALCADGSVLGWV